jgi:hypothetical protein
MPFARKSFLFVTAVMPTPARNQVLTNAMFARDLGLAFTSFYFAHYL